MVVLGAFHIMQGVIALLDSDYFPIAGDGPVTGMSLDAWGWAHRSVGQSCCSPASGVFAVKVLARTVARPAAVASLVGNFGSLDAYRSGAR